MKIEMSSGHDEVARVYVVAFAEDKWVECVESLQRPLPRQKKWVLIVSSLFGCPVKCLMCDAGSFFQGPLSAEDIFSQIDFMVKKRFPDGIVPVEKFKIQFARMGEPAFNPAVLDVLEALPGRYRAPGLIASLSTVAPVGRDSFFARLLAIKERIYNDRFQMQFSLHTTDESFRDRLIPMKKWSFSEIGCYGNRFTHTGGKKVTLNFALMKGITVDPDILVRHFSPERFLLKLTPLNPTYRARDNRLHEIPDEAGIRDVIDRLRGAGYEVIYSVGDLEENQIGSNCGQSVLNHLKRKERLPSGYSYEPDTILPVR